MKWWWGLLPFLGVLQAHTNFSGPWLTGPLIVPAGTVTPVGHYEVEPYLYVTTNSATYDSHWHAQKSSRLTFLNVQVIALIGLTEWMDAQITPSVFYGHSTARWGDLPIALDFQLLPWLKFTLQETFPSGQYQRAKNTAELSGLGTYGSNANILFYKLFHLSDLHYLSTFLSIGYTVNSWVHVHGLNAYGTGSGTVKPGDGFRAIFSFEYTLNQNWVFAMDNVYLHTNKNRSSTLPSPSEEQLSIAPAIEYNFSDNFGIIAGSWFTVAGRNSQQFYSGVIAFDLTW